MQNNGRNKIIIKKNMVNYDQIINTIHNAN